MHQETVNPKVQSFIRVLCVSLDQKKKKNPIMESKFKIHRNITNLVKEAAKPHCKGTFRWQWEECMAMFCNVLRK